MVTARRAPAKATAAPARRARKASGAQGDVTAQRRAAFELGRAGEPSPDWVAASPELLAAYDEGLATFDPPPSSARKRAPRKTAPVKKAAAPAKKAAAARKQPPETAPDAPDAGSEQSAPTPELGRAQAATLAELQALQVDTTALGVAALVVASHLDSADSAGAASQAARELRMTMGAVRSLGKSLSPPADGELPGNVTPPNRLEQLRQAAVDAQAAAKAASETRRKPRTKRASRR